jgi:hypothetical protein
LWTGNANLVSYVDSFYRTVLSNKFLSHLQVVDCRICGDPKSVLRFAFIEFTDEGNVNFMCYFDSMPTLEFHHMCVCDGYMLNYSVVVGYTEGAQAALSLSGTMLGYYPVKVLPSKTAIAPVNPTFLPRVRVLCCMAIESCQVSYNRPLCVSLILFILLINRYFGF